MKESNGIPAVYQSAYYFFPRHKMCFWQRFGDKMISCGKAANIQYEKLQLLSI